MEFTVNGKKMPEAGINALIAGHFGVPVVLVAGVQLYADKQPNFWEMLIQLRSNKALVKQPK